MDPVTLAAIKGLIEELLAPIVVKTVIQVIRAHTIDPDFQEKAAKWLDLAKSKEGGSLEDQNQVSAALYVLMGS